MSAVRANCKNVVFRLTNVCKVPGVGMLRLRGVGAALDATSLSMTILNLCERNQSSYRWDFCESLRDKVQEIVDFSLRCGVG